MGWVLALGVLLLAHQRPSDMQPPQFHEMVDLTHTVNVSAGDPHGDRVATRIDTPASVTQVPAERLIAPLVVLDVRARVAADPGYQVSTDDIAHWEQANGHMPPGAVVVARTGWNGPDWAHAPGFSAAAVHFLVENRTVYGVGIDTPSVDSEGHAAASSMRQYMRANRIYSLENVANLGRAPAAGALMVIAPAQVPNGDRAPARLVALVR